MIRGVARRLEKLEARSAAVQHSYSHVIRFITPEHEVVSTLLMEWGKPFHVDSSPGERPVGGHSHRP
jgi:hypothetical protein